MNRGTKISRESVRIESDVPWWVVTSDEQILKDLFSKSLTNSSTAKDRNAPGYLPNNPIGVPLKGLDSALSEVDTVTDSRPK